MKSSWVEQEPVPQTLTEHLRGYAEWKFEGGRLGLNITKEAFRTIRVPKIRRVEPSSEHHASGGIQATGWKTAD